MSQVPAEIAGIGSTQQKLRVSPGFDPLKAAVGPEEYFIFSRIDGMQPLRDVLFASGLPIGRAVEAVRKLRALGALLLPGESSAPVVAAPTAKPPASRAPAPPPVPAPPPRPAQPASWNDAMAAHDLRLPDPSREE
ncbi:MAG TPA: hypothetical protein VK427_15735, partial [Kofleriaceae bacterium]|nr:hypothetical protein [Kofleriaceae bacterium]